MPVIKHFDPFENILARFFPAEIALMMHKFDFQGVKEAFYDGIVPAVSFATHRTVDAVPGEQTLVVSSRILNAAIRMMQQCPFRFATPQRHRERVSGQLRIQSLAQLFLSQHLSSANHDLIFALFDTDPRIAR